MIISIKTIKLECVECDYEVFNIQIIARFSASSLQESLGVRELFVQVGHGLDILNERHLGYATALNVISHC